MTLDFRIDATRPERRQLGVRLEFEPVGPPDAPVQLFLPAWTPGSYLIREYARHLGTVVARDAASGAVLPCRKVAKNRYEIGRTAATGRVQVDYEVYAHELTVRTADVNASHAFWNHACVLLWPADGGARTARLQIAHRADWQVACSLRQEPRQRGAAADGTVVTTLLADDLDAAIDAPCLVGTFTRLDWSIDGVPHAMVLDGLAGVAPPPTLLDDVTRIVSAARAVFGGSLPYDDYVFLCLFSADGHGGLEHAASSTLLAPRTALAGGKPWRDFLGLVAHELFHAWNGKRMRPVEFWHYDYERENHTALLWLIEGWTAYYDDLLCRRAGLLSRDEYLALVAKNLDALHAAPGRLRMSLSESSFDAWIRLYRPDENTRNSSQNYYGNGALAALCLDLFVAEHSDGAHGLDDVVRQLWAESFARGRGYTRDDVDAAVRRFGGEAAVRLLAGLVDGPLDPDFAAHFASVGLRLEARGAERPHLGVTFAAGGTVVSAVESGSPAHEGGLAPQDEIVAIAGLRVDAPRWAEVWRAVARVGQAIEVLVARRGVMTECRVVPGAARGSCQLTVDAAASAARQHRRERWLDPFGNDTRPGSTTG